MQILDNLSMEKVADTYKLLIKRLRTLENGPVADSMKNLGLEYKRNSGVSTIDLKNIAKEYTGQNDLALYLWKKDLRETKILSLMIANPEQLTEDEIEEYIQGINNIELAEQAAFNMLYKLPGSIEYVKKWCGSNHLYIRVTALLTLANIALKNKNLDKQKLENIFVLFPEIAKSDNHHLKKALGRALLQVGRIDGLKNRVLQFIKEIEKTNKNTTDWLKEEVVYFLEY